MSKTPSEFNVLKAGNKLTVTRDRGGVNWETGIDIHTQPHDIKWITNKDLLYEHSDLYSTLCNALSKRPTKSGCYVLASN